MTTTYSESLDASVKAAQDAARASYANKPQLEDLAAQAAASQAAAESASANASSAASDASAAQASAAASAALVGAPAKSAMDAAMGGDVAGLVPAVAGKVSKGAMVLNVKDYGAVGNGATNDTAAFAAAFAAAGAGSVIWVPQGNFSTDNLTIPAGVKVDGSGTVKLRPQATGVPVLMTLGAGAGIRNITLDFGSGHASTGNVVRVNNDTDVAGCTIYTGVGANGVVGIGGSSTGTALTNVAIRNNRFVGTTGSFAAVQILNYVRGLRVVDNHITDTVSGITFISSDVDSMVDLVVSRNVIRVATPGGNSLPVEIQRGLRVVVSDNLVDGGTHGLSIGLANYLTCTGNIVRNQVNYGVEAGGGSNQIFSDNTVSDVGQGIAFIGSTPIRNLVVSNNVFRRCNGTSNGDAIRMVNSLASGVTYDNVSIIGNTFDEILGDGTYVQIAGDCPKSGFVVSNNVFTFPSGATNTKARAVSFEGVTRGIVSGNVISVGVDLDLVQGSAILVYGASDKIQILNNVIHSTTGGVVRTNGILFTGATLGADLTVKGNKITGFRAGFSNSGPSMAAGPTSIVVSDNLISGCTTNYELASGSYLTRTRRAYEAAAAPTAGTWAIGDIVWNNAPAAGGSPGWVCTAAGTPGTWKAMANLAA